MLAISAVGAPRVSAQHGLVEHVLAETPADSAVSPPAHPDVVPSREGCTPCPEPKVGVAIVEVLSINMVSTVFNRLYFGERGLAASPESWGRNLERGWQFDTNPFTTNQLEHPVAGSLYYSAGRSNGLDFWESVPVTAGGSLIFEYFGEANRPSFSDFVTTSLGGISLGETAYRLSSLVLDNEATGASRVLREIGGTLLNPVRGFNRLASGRMTRTGPNGFDRSPGHLRMRLDLGVQQLAGGTRLEAGYTQSYLQFELDYADPIERDLRRPFEVFRLVVQHEPSSGRVFDRLHVVGNLYGADLHRGFRKNHKFMVALNYDYLFNRAYKFGQHSVPVGILSRWSLSDSWVLRTNAAVSFVVLGAVNSGYRGRRDGYEYGPGMGFSIRAWLMHRGYRILELGHESVWIHTVSGKITNHLVQLGAARIGLPVYGGLGLGLDAYLYQLTSYQQDLPAVSRHHPQARLYVSWSID